MQLIVGLSCAIEQSRFPRDIGLEQRAYCGTESIEPSTGFDTFWPLKGIPKAACIRVLIRVEQLKIGVSNLLLHNTQTCSLTCMSTTSIRPARTSFRFCDNDSSHLSLCGLCIVQTWMRSLFYPDVLSEVCRDLEPLGR